MSFHCLQCNNRNSDFTQDRDELVCEPCGAIYYLSFENSYYCECQRETKNKDGVCDKCKKVTE